MNADEAGELARLRARAYGPHADISDDPGAVARLTELEQGGYSAGFSESGCGAGAFPAVVQFVVNSLEPAEFLARFPPGSSVQFVFDGENLGVFSDAG